MTELRRWPFDSTPGSLPSFGHARSQQAASADGRVPPQLTQLWETCSCTRGTCVLSIRSVKTLITNQRLWAYRVWSGLLSVTGATVLSGNQVFTEVWKRAPSKVSYQNKCWCHVGSKTLQAWLADPETMIMVMMSHSLSASAGLRRKVLPVLSLPNILTPSVNLKIPQIHLMYQLPVCFEMIIMQMLHQYRTDHLNSSIKEDNF